MTTWVHLVIFSQSMPSSFRSLVFTSTSRASNMTWAGRSSRSLMMASTSSITDWGAFTITRFPET